MQRYINSENSDSLTIKNIAQMELTTIYSNVYCN